MVLKAAFMFVAPGVSPETDRSTLETPAVELTTIGVKDYAQAAAVARQLADEGIVAIELCGGFGHKGTAMVAQAVPETVAVGVVRFDNHPGLGGKSGDSMI